MISKCPDFEAFSHIVVCPSFAISRYTAATDHSSFLFGSSGDAIVISRQVFFGKQLQDEQEKLEKVYFRLSSRM